MQITFHPKRLLLSAAFAIGLSAILSSAIGVSQSGIGGAGAVLPYLLFDVVFSVNPSAWQGRQTDRR